jgi:endonuclease V-like protein UPF0215 family
MTSKRFSNIIGFDDAPFDRNSNESVPVVGAVYAAHRMDGILIGKITRDGGDATRVIGNLVAKSKFSGHVQLVMLQGIAMAGFNVVDVKRLGHELNLPVLVVARRQPDFSAIQRALVNHVKNGRQKWNWIANLGAMEPIDAVFVQRVGISIEQADDVIKRFAVHSHIPEPIRTAHLIAGALVDGESRGNP